MGRKGGGGSVTHARRRTHARHARRTSVHPNLSVCKRSSALKRKRYAVSRHDSHHMQAYPTLLPLPSFPPCPNALPYVCVSLRAIRHVCCVIRDVGVRMWGGEERECVVGKKNGLIELPVQRQGSKSV